MKYLKLLALPALAACLSCGSSSKENATNYIKVGVTAGPEMELAKAAKKEAKERYNLDVELVTFNDYVIPNEALAQGDIDVNAFQHIPYLAEQSRQRGYKLVVVGKTFIYPIVAYSRKIKDLSALADGSTIAIPNDPTNGGRSLLLLEKQGLIKLRDDVGLLPKVTDIEDNPRQVKIVEIEAPQLPHALDDPAVTIAVINNNFAVQAGLDARTLGVFKEDRESPYVNVIVSREDNKNEEKVKAFVRAYQSRQVENVAEKMFKGGAVKGW